MQTSLTRKTVFVGLDWADKTHAFHLDADGTIETGTMDQDAATIEAQVNQWQDQHHGCSIAIAVETSKGPIITALLNYPDVVIYPINPAALAAYRKAFAHGGGKNDPGDARLLCRYLKLYVEDLRPLSQDKPLTRKLKALTEDRRRLVDQRTAHCNELKAVLKSYYPEVLRLDAAKIYADFIIAFLLKYPTLAKAKKAGANRLRKFFYAVGPRRKAEQRVAVIAEALSLSHDETLIETSARRVTALVNLIQTYNKQIRNYDEEIARVVGDHEDCFLYKSLPGAAHLTQARMIAAMGDDRSRYDSPAALQAASGIAPLTTQSGKQRFVSSRWACSKFLRQTFHEFAGLSIKSSRWAAAFYKLQRDKGKSPQMAKRALAYKWQRIIYRCWNERKPYDENQYLKRLKQTGSPTYILIATEETKGKHVDNLNTKTLQPT